MKRLLNVVTLAIIIIALILFGSAVLTELIGLILFGSAVGTDDFEWGNNGDLLSVSGGGVTWVTDSHSKGGDSVAEIDDSQQYSGTKSARFYYDRVHEINAWFEQSQASYLGCHVKKEDSSQFILLHGDGSCLIYVIISPWEMLRYYDYDHIIHDVRLLSADEWYLLEIRNIDWTNHTYDIYVDGYLEESGATMMRNASVVGRVRFRSHKESGSFWIDDLKVN